MIETLHDTESRSEFEECPKKENRSTSCDMIIHNFQRHVFNFTRNTAHVFKLIRSKYTKKTSILDIKNIENSKIQITENFNYFDYFQLSNHVQNFHKKLDRF